MATDGGRGQLEVAVAANVTYLVLLSNFTVSANVHAPCYYFRLSGFFWRIWGNYILSVSLCRANLYTYLWDVYMLQLHALKIPMHQCLTLWFPLYTFILFLTVNSDKQQWIYSRRMSQFVKRKCLCYLIGITFTRAWALKSEHDELANISTIVQSQYIYIITIYIKSNLFGKRK